MSENDREQLRQLVDAILSSSGQKNQKDATSAATVPARHTSRCFIVTDDINESRVPTFIVNVEIMTSEDKIGSLEDEALKRKERLKNLKRKINDHGKDENKVQEIGTLPKPKFRSYVPEDEKLKENVIPAAKPGDVEGEVKEQLEAANSRVVIEELDLTNLAPRKPDWDLKRDVAKKLERLEKRTQRAIAELIRERLKTGQADLATSVGIGARANEDDVDED